MRKYSVVSLEDLKVFSKEIYKLDAKVFLLSGDLGAGKTTFVGAFIKENLQSMDESFDDLGVMSPTFSLINCYITKNKSIVHADMYRVGQNDFEIDELLEAVADADYVFIEWPSKIENLEDHLTTYDVLSLDFKINSDKSRTVFVKQL